MGKGDLFRVAADVCAGLDSFGTGIGCVTWDFSTWGLVLRGFGAFKCGCRVVRLHWDPLLLCTGTLQEA